MAQAYKPLPAAEELWELFSLDPFTGTLYRKKARRTKEEQASRQGNDGYRRVRIGGTRYKAHRLVWAWIHGIDPAGLDVDHIQGKQAGDMPWNLRLATRAENTGNQKSRGWDYDARSGKYQARIRHNYKCISLGAYKTPEEARAAYEKAARALRKAFSPV